ncbi:hypothetical protein KRMM14A1004_21470 [Krasilnikovia sp. MM14-A1004]
MGWALVVAVAAPVGRVSWLSRDSMLRPQVPQRSSPTSRYVRWAPSGGRRLALTAWAATKSDSLTSASCDGLSEIAHYGDGVSFRNPATPGATSSVRRRWVCWRFQT